MNAATIREYAMAHLAYSNVCIIYFVSIYRPSTIAFLNFI